MKREKFVCCLVMLFLLSTVLFFGCSVGPGKRSAVLSSVSNSEGYQVSYSDSYKGVLMPINSPESLSRSDYYASRAAINRAIAKQITKTGDTAKASGFCKYSGIIMNDELEETFYLMHPYLNDTFEIPPQGYLSLRTPGIPDYVRGYFESQDEISKDKIFKEGGYNYHGQDYDYGARVSKD